MGRPAYYVPLLAVALAMALMVGATPPTFYPDAYLYLHSGFLWSEGAPGFSGTLIGARDLAVLFYHLPLALFGATVRTLSTTLALVNLAASLLLILLVASCRGRSLSSLLITLGLMVYAFITPIWDVAWTDNLFLVVALGVLLVLRLAHTASTPLASLAWFAVLGLLCGVATGVRSEALLLLLASMLATLAPIPALPAIRQRAGACLVALVAFVVSAQAIQGSYEAWTGQARPAQNRGLILFYRQLSTQLNPADGPASAQLSDLAKDAKAGMAETEFQYTNPLFLAAGKLYVEQGAEAMTQVFSRAGAETLRSHPVQTVLLTAKSMIGFLIAPPPRLGIVRQDDPREALAALDAFYAQNGAALGYPKLHPLAYMAEGSAPGIPRLYGHIPGVVFAVLLLAAAVYVVRRRKFTGPLAVALLLIGMLLPLTAFSQGYTLRYWILWQALLVVAWALECAPPPIPRNAAK